MLSALLADILSLFELTLLLFSTANYLKSNAAALAAGNFDHALLPAFSLKTIKGLVHPKTIIYPHAVSLSSM